MPVAALSTAPGSPRHRLQRMSLWMRALIAAGALVLLGVVVWMCVSDTALLDTYRRLSDSAAVSAERLASTPSTRVWIVATTLPGVLLALYGLLQAWHLFGAYGKGVVFGPAASGRLRRLGWVFIATAFVRPAAETVLVLLLSWHNPPGQRRLVLGFGWEDYLCLLFGGLLFAVSWAMVEATRLETENAGFV
ncbi:MAG: DUF2975 domain-containing protein [Burkholderiaceae bacterium]